MHSSKTKTKDTKLPLSNIIFAWYRKNAGNACIEYIGEEMRIYKSDVEDETPDNYFTGKSHLDDFDYLIDQAFESEN